MSAESENYSLQEYALNVAQRSRSASRVLATATGEQKDRWLRCAAERIRSCTANLLDANARDIERAPEFGLTSAATDRLRLTEKRLAQISAALEQVVALRDPVGEVIDSHVRPNGLSVSRVRVPLGVVFFIYESRPNVTVDAAALCVKSGNAVVLRGGKEAFYSNQALHAVLSESLMEVGLPPECVQLVETTNREAVGHFLRLHQWIDVTIPRGGRSLIERVTAEATMPVIKHFDGICHVYVDRAADCAMAESIVVNSKCQRPGVCNAAECLLVHRDVAETFLPRIAKELRNRQVELRCCPRACELVPGCRLATEEDFRTEYLDLILSVKVVDDLEQAVQHIDEYGSHHTDAIVTDDLKTARRFAAAVDSSAVHINASTRFNDGGEFGLGAEIGISTDKFHARGPCGLRELTSYKFVVQGDGHVRE